ncbi:DUF1330 domain-containing protein [Celeribacter sp.]|uniref:DUF1330 domain-containing protein n=1 Tax=Celeribacter sp. TaxID=1890673 RepID=UPI003A91EF9C
MPYYVVARVDVTDKDTYKEYARRTEELITAHGGKFLVMGAPIEHVEGHGPDHLVVIEFPDRDAAEAAYMSDAYHEIVALGMRSSSRDVMGAWGVGEDVHKGIVKQYNKDARANASTRPASRQQYARSGERLATADNVTEFVPRGAVRPRADQRSDGDRND